MKKKERVEKEGKITHGERKKERKKERKNINNKSKKVKAKIEIII